MSDNISRRDFIHSTLVAGCLLLLPAPLKAEAKGSPSSKSKGVLVDITKCVGCGLCQAACEQWNNLPMEQVDRSQDTPSLSAWTWTLPELTEIEKDGEVNRVFAKRQCMHCLHPACVSACPVGALRKTESGPVVYDASRCIGCRYCMVACPFGIPKLEWEKSLPRIRKCTFCADRQQAGLEPACTAACPTGALTFGNREDLIAEAEARLQEHPERYVSHLYGKDELGGTSWMYLSPVSFEELDFPDLETESVTQLSETVATYGTAGIVVGVTAVLGGLYRFSKRTQDTENTRQEGESEA
ncbi:MAG: hypothetical protein B6I34_00765 [Anaerolineaceae bacterium 4572_32.1]|nr:MAG: hypothetical protein B6I34_00765 [Anaerolineaceae bacterium 4572_32.1]